MLLGLGVDHLDRHGLLTGLSRDDLGSEHAGAGVDGARLDQQAVGETADFRVESGHQSVHGLDEGDLAAQCGVHVGELESDVSGADDSNILFHCRLQEKMVSGLIDWLIH